MPGPGKVFSLSATLSPIPLLPLLRADQSHLGTFCRARRREGPRGEPAPLAWSGDLGQKSAPLHAPAPVLGFVVPSGWERSTRPGPGTVRASQRGCLSGDPYLSVGSSLWLETCFQADCETLKMGATGCPRGTSRATGKLPTALTGDGREAACSSRECGRAGAALGFRIGDRSRVLCRQLAVDQLSQSPHLWGGANKPALLPCPDGPRVRGSQAQGTRNRIRRLPPTGPEMTSLPGLGPSVQVVSCPACVPCR